MSVIDQSFAQAATQLMAHTHANHFFHAAHYLSTSRSIRPSDHQQKYTIAQLVAWWRIAVCWTMPCHRERIKLMWCDVMWSWGLQAKKADYAAPWTCVPSSLTCKEIMLIRWELPVVTCAYIGHGCCTTEGEGLKQLAKRMMACCLH